MREEYDLAIGMAMRAPARRTCGRRTCSPPRSRSTGSTALHCVRGSHWPFRRLVTALGL